MPTLKQKLLYLILGQKGGNNRARILKLLKERPYNINQMAEKMDVNYRTIKHHIEMLERNDIVSGSKTGGYGEVYYLIPKLEEDEKLFEDLMRKVDGISTSPKMIESVMEGTGDAVILLDEDKEVMFWNKGAESIFGYQSGEVLGSNPPIIKDKKIEDILFENLEKEGGVIGKELRMDKASGEPLDVSVTLDRIEDREDNLVGYSLIARDITKRKRLEERMRSLNSVLKSINDVHKALIEENNLETVIQESCEILRGTRNYLDVSVSMLDRDRNKIIPLGHSGDHERERWVIDAEGKGKVPACVKEMFETPEIRMIESSKEECKECGYCRHEDDHQTLLIPMKHKDALTGLMIVCVEKDHDVGDEELDLLEEIAGDMISARARLVAEEALRESENRYNLALFAADMGSWDWNFETGELVWSDMIEPMFGLDVEEFGGTFEDFLERVHPDDRQLVRDKVDLSMERGEDYELEHRIVWPDGTVRWVRETGEVILDENKKPVRMLGVVLDITDRKKDQEALVESDKRTRELAERFNLITKATKDAIWDWDLENETLWHNEAYATNFGYEIRDIEKPEDWWRAHLHPDDKDKVLDKLKEVLDKGKKNWRQEFRYQRKDGSYAYVLDRGFIIFEENGKPVRMVGSMMDITERKEWEKKIMEKEEEINRLLGKIKDL